MNTPRHSKAPWKTTLNNVGEIQSATGEVVAYVVQAADLGFMTAEEYARAEVESLANERLIKAAPALFQNLAFAIWCLTNPGMGPTPEALATMRAALELADPAVKGGVS